MTTASSLTEAVRAAWAKVPAAPADELKYMEWGWGAEAARAFTGIAPVDVDIHSVGFQAATPLLDLPPRAAAVYLGTFVLSLLEGLGFQLEVGIFTDPLSRAHTLTCLTSKSFWERSIRPFLPRECQDVLREVVVFLAAQADALALKPKQVSTMLALSAPP